MLTLLTPIVIIIIRQKKTKKANVINQALTISINSTYS
jgi:hypothetical protein